MLTETYDRCNYAAAPAAVVVTRIKGFVNETQQELASDPKLATLRRAPITFASVNAQQTYGLPPVIARIFDIRETTTKRKLWQKSLDWYRTVAPDPSTTSGTPAYYVLLGQQAVNKQPSDASELFVKSDNAADTTQALKAEVVRSGSGQTQLVSVNLNGTTGVSLGATITDIVEVRDWYLSAVAAGNVTLREDTAAGTELARIGIGQMRARYEGIALYPTPSAAITYLVDYEMDVSDMVNDTDEPAWLPYRFHRLIPLGARVKEYEKTENERLKTAVALFEKGRNDLLAYVNNPPDGGVLLPVAEGVGISDLVGQYPAGTLWQGF